MLNFRPQHQKVLKQSFLDTNNIYRSFASTRMYTDISNNYLHTIKR